MKFSIKAVVFLMGIWLCACNQSPQTKIEPTTQESTNSAFIGCYTINYHTPAQIKISQQNNQYVMQMKEPTGAKSVWDTPEPLNVMDIDAAWDFFAVNALNLNKSDIQAVLARPDKMMVLAHIKPASKNINPMLDSAFVVYIFRGSNTIYQVECDDTLVDIVKKID